MPVDAAAGHDRDDAANVTLWSRLRAEISVFSVFSLSVVAVFTLLAVYPLARVFLRLFWNDGRFDFGPIISIYTQSDIGTLLLNTAIVVAGSATVALVVGSVLAWINERTDARIGVLTDVLPLMPFLVPPIAGAIGWVFLLSDRSGFINAWLRVPLNAMGFSMRDGPLNIYSWSGLIFVYSVYAVPYVYLVVSSGLRNVDSALEEQSRICGRSVFQTMLRVTIPAVRPSLGAAALLMVWFSFALFSVPAIIGTGAGIDVLAVRMVKLVNFTYPPNLEGAIGLGLIIILAVGTAWFMQKRVLARARHATIGGKGNSFTRIELGRWRLAARLVLLSYILVAAVLPLMALLLVSLNGFWTPWINLSNLSLSSFNNVLFGNVQTSLALRNSIVLGLVGATIGTIAAATLALFVRKYGGTASAIVDGVVKLPASVSSIVLAVGFILAFSGPPFNLNGTFLILLLGYLVLYMPQASVAADAAAAQVGKELTEASHISGASAGRTFLRISMPLMAAGLVAGWMLLFVRMISDLTVSAVLAGTRNPVVGFRILEIYEGGNFATLAALSTILTLISAVVVTALMIFTKRMTRTSNTSV